MLMTENLFDKKSYSFKIQMSAVDLKTAVYVNMTIRELQDTLPTVILLIYYQSFNLNIKISNFFSPTSKVSMEGHDRKWSL